MSRRYILATFKGEGGTVWNIVDAHAPEPEQPAVVRSFHSRNRGETYMTVCCALDRMNRAASGITKSAVLVLAVLLLSGCVHRAPLPCCCVLGDHERSEPDYCDPADCEVHHGEVE